MYDHMHDNMCDEHATSLPNIRPKPLTNPNSIPSLNYSQSVTFEFFRSRTMQEMAGIRSSSFWQNVVFPACYTEPAILHASMALANASQWRRLPRSKSRSIDNEARRVDTISEYNKAIAHLKVHFTDHHRLSSLRVILVTCILFIALELSTGRITEAVMHLEEGRKVLHSSCRQITSDTERPGTATDIIVLPPKPQSAEDEIVAIFVDMDLQSTFFGSTKPQLNLSAYPMENSETGLEYSFVLPECFQSIDEANQYLVVLTNKCLQFVGDTVVSDQHSLRNQLSNFRRQQLNGNLKDWRMKYDHFSVTVSPDAKSEPTWKRQSAFMLLQHAWLSIVVPTSFYEVKETDSDVYIEEYATIADLACSILPSEEARPGHFSLEFGLLPPLWWTVMKCRHQQIRRKALHAIKRAGIEGLWDPGIIYQLGRECILLEEGIENLDEVEQELDREGDWRDLIPLQRRISAVDMEFEPKDYNMLRMTFRRKIWDTDGRCTGLEEVVRRQPNESLQAPV
jgi:transcription factor-like protein